MGRDTSTRLRGWPVRSSPPVAWRAAWLCVVVAAAALGPACTANPSNTPSAGDTRRSSILLVTLDTTRADTIGPEASGIRTPAFDGLAARGLRFRQAYATTPETLPSHASMMTGLYPAGHGIRENGRFLSERHPVVADRLREAGYRTAAFVSAFALARRFGLARGFDVYDDAPQPAGGSERSARATTDAALAFLGSTPAGTPLFLWVHYYDPHAPYEPPDPFAAAYRGKPYLGEVAAMDEQMGRLLRAFDERAQGAAAVVVVSDHGEGLGDHGEPQHGSLVYQSTMHVPLAIAGPGLAAGISDHPVSTRRVFHTLLDFAGLDATGSLRTPGEELVIGEAMKPFLQYGWQPQVMGVSGRYKAILTGTLEVFDVVADPGETRDVAARSPLPPSVVQSLEAYPVPSPDAATPPGALDEDARRQLASLGYVSATAAPVVRKDAPRPADMTHIFGLLEQASALFAVERYVEVLPLLERIVEADPYNLDARLRLATALSALGRDDRALAAFTRAAAIAPRSQDVQLYLALHYARGPQWSRAVPLLEAVLAEAPMRLPALEALADVRERQERLAEAIELRQRVHALREPGAGDLLRLGRLAMSLGRTDLAIASFEQARDLQAAGFTHDLELGVLYLSAQRLAEARAALDRVKRTHPDYPMALFKRAQVSVLLNEPDRAARIAAARQGADPTTRELIARERLFK